MATLIPKEKPKASPVSAIERSVASDGNRDYSVVLVSFRMLVQTAVSVIFIDEENKVADTPRSASRKLPGSRKGPAFSI